MLTLECGMLTLEYGMLTLECGMLIGAQKAEIDLALRFPPRHLAASRLRDLGASRLPDLRIIGKKVKLDLKDL